MRQYESDPETTLAHYQSAGYEIGDALVGFVQTYMEMRLIWSYGDRVEVELTTDRDCALRVHTSWVDEAERTCRIRLWPIGEVFDTCDALLLGADGVLYTCGDDGVRRIAQGFEQSLSVLVSDCWDKAVLS